MNETLADLYRQAGLQSAWQQQPEAQPGYAPPRPRPRSMRPAIQRLYDRNQGVRDQAGQQVRQEREMAALPDRAMGGYTGYAERNQVEEFGRGAMEMTGAPAWARGIQDVQHGRPGEAIPEFLMGALNTAGIATLPLGGGARVPMRQQAPPVRAPMIEPPVAPQRAPQATPELPPQRPPVSERLDAGALPESNAPDGGRLGAGNAPTLGPVARYQFAGPRGQQYELVIAPDEKAGVAAIGFARVRTDGYAARYRPHNDLTPGEARSVYREVARLIHEDATRHGRSAYSARGYTGRQTALYEALAEANPLPGYARDTASDALVFRRETGPPRPPPNSPQRPNR